MIANAFEAPVCPFPTTALSLPKGKHILSLCVSLPWCFVFLVPETIHYICLSGGHKCCFLLLSSSEVEIVVKEENNEIPTFTPPFSCEQTSGWSPEFCDCNQCCSVSCWCLRSQCWASSLCWVVAQMLSQQLTVRATPSLEKMGPGC